MVIPLMRFSCQYFDQGASLNPEFDVGGVVFK